MEFAICTKNMELLKLYSKEKTNFFCLIKLLKNGTSEKEALK